MERVTYTTYTSPPFSWGLSFKKKKCTERRKGCYFCSGKKERGAYIIKHRRVKASAQAEHHFELAL